MPDDASRQWIRWGEVDPWYGVLSEAEFRGGGNRADFFRRGEEQVARILTDCRRLGVDPQGHGRALEFGCGVGRILAPLARAFPQAVGIDISPGMLAEAEAVLAGMNVDLRLADAENPLPLHPNETFHFVYCGLVLQHIPPRRGRELMGGLLARLAPGGVAVIQAPYRTRQKLRYWLNRLRASHQLLFDLSRLLTGRFREVGAPVMQMNVYEPAEMEAAARDTGCDIRWVELDRDDFDYLDLATWYLVRPH